MSTQFEDISDEVCPEKQESNSDFNHCEGRESDEFEDSENSNEGENSGPANDSEKFIACSGCNRTFLACSGVLKCKLCVAQD